VSAPQVSSQIVAVAFDCGGVMTRPRPGDNVEFVSLGLGVDAATVKRTFSVARRQLAAGELSESAFWRGYASAHGGAVPSDWAATYQAHFAATVEVHPEMVELVNELRSAEIRTAILSNVIPSRVPVYRDLGVYDGFDPLVLSCDVGMVKPHREIFEHLLQRLDLNASRVVFVDDKAANIEAAREVGLQAIQFSSHGELRAGLRGYGVPLQAD